MPRVRHDPCLWIKHEGLPACQVIKFTVVTPDTLLRWYRKLVAAKYDGSRRRKPGRLDFGRIHYWHTTTAKVT